jgi:hypothetical protein
LSSWVLGGCSNIQQIWALEIQRQTKNIIR